MSHIAHSTIPYSVHLEAVVALREKGFTLAQIAEKLGCHVSRIKKVSALASKSSTVVQPAATQEITTETPISLIDDLRSRVATDELTVPFSNWLGRGWYREFAEPQEIYETDQDGHQQLVGLKVDPGVMWPDDYDAAKDTDGIWVSPNVPAPRTSLKRGYIISMAQALTPVHGPLLINMCALSEARGGYDIIIGGATYGKSLFAKRRKADIMEVAPWSSLIADLVTRERVELHPKIQFCAEMNMRPTKSNPLTGLNRYIRGITSLFAHPKRAITSVPRGQYDEPITMWSTGACTVPNYVTQEAGLKALQNHTMGFVIVEIDNNDEVFIRNVDADDNGDFFDLDLIVSGAEVHTVDEAVDIDIAGLIQRPFMGIPCTHRAGIHDPYARALWGYGGNPVDDIPLIDLVKASGQAFNDLFDGAAINHHEERNPLAMYRRHSEKRTAVEPEIEQAARFVAETSREWCKSYIIYSNHDDFLHRWLQKPSTEVAVENSKLWHQANYEYRAAVDQAAKFDVFDWVLRRAVPDADFTLITSDDPLNVYGTFYNFHGDQGSGGSKGSTVGLARLGINISKAHDHILSWLDGVISMGNLIFRAAYAKGPTAWAGAWHIGHCDGNRQVGLLVGDKYRA
ncbi:hypothetical protein [Pararhizobium sp.]|uniref:hypothetical protein n=1 Tax=Pararhizobium sp. TaxID=1977563 RepID=UPI003D14073C